MYGGLDGADAFRLGTVAGLNADRHTLSLGLIDRLCASERSVEWALQAALRDLEGYYRVGEVTVATAPPPKR